MRASQARRLQNKSSVKIYPAPFHVRTIRERAQSGWDYVMFDDFTPAMITGFRALGYTAEIHYRFGIFGKRKLMVSW